MDAVKIRVLLLEDNPVQAKVMMDQLQKFPNAQFEVVWADRISKAFEKLRQPDQFDVIISDLETPDTVNLEAVEKFHERVPNIPLVVLIESEKETRLGREALQRGAQDYLTKDAANSSILTRIIQSAVEWKNLDEKVQAVTGMKSKFISLITNSFYTPLTVIEEGIEMISTEMGAPISQKQQSNLQLVKSNLGYLTRLVHDLLDFQKLESGRKELRVQVVNLYELINETVQACSPFASQKGLELKCEFAAQLPRVVCDRARIVQVLTHFLNNAIKFTEHGRILIVSEVKQNFIRVSVCDQGPGIQREDQPKLFQMFSQISEDTKKTDGIGMGLFISKKIIETHGGRVGVQSELGKGATFYFELPLEQRVYPFYRLPLPGQSS